MPLEPRDGRPGAPGQAVKLGEIAGGEVLAVDGVLQMVLALHQRSSGDVEEQREVAVRPPSKPLGDTGNRDPRTAVPPHGRVRS